MTSGTGNDLLIKRLIEFYLRFDSDAPGLSKIWTGITSGYQVRLISALRSRDAAAVQSVFDDPQDVLHGLDHVVMQNWGKEITTDFFPRLAQRIGVLPIRNPSDLSPDENWKSVDGIELRRRIEEMLGTMRVANGFLSVCTDNGIPYMHFLKLGQWFTIQSLLGRTPKRVLEIGAGCGGLAQVAWQNGVRDYTIIDLPSTAVISAYYMSKVYGGDKIWLAGEPPNAFAVGRWFPHCDYSAALYNYDLIANCNSFPEITSEQQDGYLNFIQKCINEDGVFYSSNHESNSHNQRSVRAAVNIHGGFTTVYRAPSMIREGYVEEIYRRK